MYCRQCGSQIADDTPQCPYCGCTFDHNHQATNTNTTTNTSANAQGADEPKTVIGVIMSIFLGVIGIVIGLLMFPEGTVSRKTFIKGWLIAFIVQTVLGVLLGIIVFAIAFGTSMDMAESMTELPNTLTSLLPLIRR